MTDSMQSSGDFRFDRLLHYFELAHRQAPKPIPHPDKSVNDLVHSQRDSLRHAAVLIPVTKHAANRESHIVLTVRSENLNSHAGQVSFPGGSREEQDRDLVATALRETEEEIGVPAENVRVLGILGDLALPSGFLITPVVGVLETEQVFTPCPIEVADVFQVPLELAMSPAAYRSSSVSMQFRQRRILELYYEDYRIWGATAAILFHLASELDTVDSLEFL